jgi:hypothetical protein
MLLLFPLFQQCVHWPAEKVLIGIRIRTAEFPQWTVKTWQSGQFSVEADAWIREHVGLRSWLVMLNRQIRYSLFGQVAPAPLHKRSVVIGKAPFLHENLYIAEALRRPVVTPEKMEVFAKSLAQVQDLLNAHGVAFLVILAPNKALLYSDTLPRWAQARVADQNADFPAFLEALQRHQVSCLDTMALFRKLRPEFPDLVTPHSSHWSYHGAWVAWQHAISILNQQHILPEIPVPATEKLVLQNPLNMDDELREQLNLFWGAHLTPIPAAYPVVASVPPESEQKLETLIVGDSYGFGLMDALARSRLCNHIQYLFYMHSAYEAVPGFFDSHQACVMGRYDNLGLFRNSNENGQRFLAGKNLVLLVLTSFNIDKYSWGFDRMVNRLYGNSGDTPLPLYNESTVDLED